MNWNPLSALYGGVVGGRNALYDSGWWRSRALQGPVISVGNLSTGGSGKTPFVILLGELLKARGIRFDVLSRGYGRTTRGVLLVEPGGLPRDFGDEPLLIARRLQAPVIIGEDRYEAGRLAEARFGPQMHLLDDGFQHRGLARDFDIVLVTPDDARDRLLPGGRLREPLRSLERADAVVLASGASPESFPVAGKIVWRVRRGIIPQNVPPRPIVFCGIARPQNFLLQLRAAGVDPAAEAFFRDHHSYTEKDIHDLLQLRERSEAGGFVTTEKDAVNLGGYLDALAPLAVVPVKMELTDAANAVDTMLRAIEGRRRRS
ncbi:MAG TPA: tetraacyldisaccharide 4'-kinase [Candidatus Dormibacteraeota bacterium]|jgi:tetraacyldisaccharide 4'-kinase|nr:tetraacyldisaccharide 4'-kinase [Candidatus Dormibacteraeota bacterium]